MIDRRGLVGVGELTTPRWTRARHDKEDTTTPVWGSQGERFEIAAAEDRPDAPDSPWTIEAVDGEMSEREEVCCSLSYLAQIFHVVFSSQVLIQPRARSARGLL